VRTWAKIALTLLWGSFLLLTSVYCLLSYLPYTFYALIKAPPYAWMPFFVRHHAFLYCTITAMGALAFWPKRITWDWMPGLSMAVAVGGYFAAKPVLWSLQNDTAAYIWSLIPLLLAIALCTPALCGLLAKMDESIPPRLISLRLVAPVALLVGIASAAGFRVCHYLDVRVFDFHALEAELTAWSIATHLVVAVLIVTLVNVATLAVKRTRRPRATRVLLIFLMLWIGLAVGLSRFLANALGFEGWEARIYATLLSATVNSIGACLLLSLATKESREFKIGRSPLFIGMGALALVSIALPSIVAGGDWNGVQQATFAVVFWCAAAAFMYHMQRQVCEYKLRTVVAVAVFAVVAYGTLYASAFLWAKPLGNTADDVNRALDNYAVQDVSFGLAHHLLGNGHVDPCTDLCRILREYTNIRGAEAKHDVSLVEKLAPSLYERPNIFIFVVDSMRPDYLGAYNPQVDFTPNLDGLARDSVAFRNAYTEYMGTTLSEPAIWAGARLLHAHYLQPFSKVNNLEKLAQTDGYQLVVSYDTVLSEVLSPSTQLVKLDQDKLWNAYDVCSTVREMENWVEHRTDSSRPILFYSQPMNLHQFARNDEPGPTAKNWRMRSGFNNRIAYELSQVDNCMGSFVGYLKQNGLYNNSILVVTSDHGDATGEFGRFSHSLIIYPEVMRVPLIVHLPKRFLNGRVYDQDAIVALTDITPSLYELLGHTPIGHNTYFGRPLFAHTREELKSYRRTELFLASDARAAYGILDQDGRYLYATYDSPAQSFLFDLAHDPQAQHSILTPALKQAFDQRIIQELQGISTFYGHRPDAGLILTSEFGANGLAKH